MKKIVTLCLGLAAGANISAQSLQPCWAPPSGGTITASANGVCAGTPVLLTGADTGLFAGLSYQWQVSEDGRSWKDLPGATTPSLSAEQKQSCAYRRVISCGDARSVSEPIRVEVRPGPPAPYIESSGTMLRSSFAGANQWYLNGSPIPGATTPTYAPTQPGVYAVQAADDRCAGPLSSPFTLSPAALNSPELEAQLVLAPNPVRDDLVIRYTGSEAAFTVTVLDLSGKKKWTEGILTSFFRVDMSRYPAGYYVIQVSNRRTGAHVQKMVVKE